MDKFEFVSKNPAEKYQDDISYHLENIDYALQIGSADLFDYARSSLRDVYLRLLGDVEDYTLLFVHLCEQRDIDPQPELKGFRDYISNIRNRIIKNNDRRF